MDKCRKVKEIFVGHLMLDDVVLSDGSTRFNSPGGAALYAASGAYLWENSLGFLSKIGYDYSPENFDKLIGYGLDLSGIKRVKGPSIHIWALYDQKGYRYFIPQTGGGTYEDLSPSPEDIPGKCS